MTQFYVWNVENCLERCRTRVCISWFSFLSLRRKSSTIKPPKPYKRRMANGANASSYSKKAEAGTRNNKKICTPDIPRCLYESCDSSKLCGVQIGTVEVLFYNDHIFLCLAKSVFISLSYHSRIKNILEKVKKSKNIDLFYRYIV